MECGERGARGRERVRGGAAGGNGVTTSVEPHNADEIVRGVRHGVVRGSMGFGWFGHPSCAVE